MCHDRTLNFFLLETNTKEELAEKRLTNAIFEMRYVERHTADGQHNSGQAAIAEPTLPITSYAWRNITEKEEKEAKAEFLPLLSFAREHFRMMLFRGKVKRTIGGYA